MSNFKRGDIVTGTKESNDRYGLTTSFCKAKVQRVYNEGQSMELTIREHEKYNRCVGKTYCVSTHCFKLVSTSKYKSIEKNYNI